jgi:hypothetical protein
LELKEDSFFIKIAEGNLNEQTLLKPAEKTKKYLIKEEDRLKAIAETRKKN